MTTSASITTERHQQRELFDQSYPVGEQLPRRFSVEFSEVRGQHGPTVVLQKDGHQIGDPLTDHSFVDDGDRYHDVFHFANAAILGWSPMTRSLFGCKRRSNQQIAVVEDGGRAKVLEEVVCALIYDYGRQHDFHVDAASISDDFIKLLRRITNDREVGRLCDEYWRELIELSLKTWKLMREHRGGVLEADLCNRKIKFIRRDSQPRTHQSQLFSD